MVMIDRKFGRFFANGTFTVLGNKRSISKFWCYAILAKQSAALLSLKAARLLGSLGISVLLNSLAHSLGYNLGSIIRIIFVLMPLISQSIFFASLRLTIRENPELPSLWVIGFTFKTVFIFWRTFHRFHPSRSLAAGKPFGNDSECAAG
jgi:hypothetical protein